MEDIVQFYCSKYTYTKASAHMHDLQQSGFQPGALVSGNMRNRVFRNLVAGELSGCNSVARWGAQAVLVQSQKLTSA